jgi:DDE family transposase
VWLELALTAADLLAWTQTILLQHAPDLAKAEWKMIRYRLLHTAARITRSSPRTWLRLHKGWPWALALARAFDVLRHVSIPATA